MSETNQETIKRPGDPMEKARRDEMHFAVGALDAAVTSLEAPYIASAAAPEVISSVPVYADNSSEQYGLAA